MGTQMCQDQMFATCEAAPGGEYALMNGGGGGDGTHTQGTAAVSTGCLQSTHQAAHNHL